MTKKTNNDHLQTLNDIRDLMERSSRFISLSGLSGVAAGVSALLGATLVYVYLGIGPFSGRLVAVLSDYPPPKWGLTAGTFFLLTAFVVLVLALSGGIYFTTRRARRKGQKIWDRLTFRLVVNLSIPLLAGGFFCIGLMYHGLWFLIAPATLVFYGLALLNGSKYTLNDIRYLGILEIILGCIGLFYPGFGLELWAIGFGILHILYGAAMYVKYERI
ncbi:MAG: hypothetical protein D6714_04180 [Bacteroidetes bacterium]|nr:MAG: hypothetical protein D6714_04180 [Bacteroidota bacterium]